MSARIDKITQQKVALFKNEIDKMSKLGILPFEVGKGEFRKVFSAETLSEAVDELQKTRLTIAVCGAVKSGKSTFLNSVLFGQDVLPAFETPCTAKLTFITYTEKLPSFSVDFFSSASEYREMKSKLPGEALLEWERREAKAVNSGVSPSKLFGTTYEGSGANGFAELHDYVAEDGKYVSFVKQVTLKINRPELKNLFVVDTPGLDDPNPLNSWVTEQWASQAHAVIYLMPWRGLNAEDRKFLQNNFGELNKRSGRTSRNRVFVITQIDRNKGWVDVLHDFKESFPAEKDNVCGYSAYVDLLRQRESIGDLSEDERDLFEGKFSGFNADPQNVRELIAKRLYSGDVAIRAEKCENLIKGCYAEFITHSKDEYEELKITEHNLGLSVEEAERNLVKLAKCREELDGGIDNVTQTEQNRLQGVGSVNEKLDSARKIALKTAYRLLDGTSRDSQIIPNVSMATDDVNSQMKVVAEKVVAGFIADAEQAFVNVARYIRMMIDNSGCDSQIHEPDTTVVQRLAQDLIESIGVAVDLNALENAISFFNSTSTNVARAKAMISSSVLKSNKELDISIKNFVRKCREAIEAYASNTKKGLSQRFDELETNKKLSPDKKRKELDGVKKKLKGLEKRIKLSEKAVAECSFA